MQGFFKKSTLVAAICSAIGSQAVAQDNTNEVVAQDDAFNILEEVIVTATRHARSVQKVEYNISALTGDELDRQGIANQADMFRVVPGAEFFDHGPRSSISNTNLVLRGVNVDDLIRVAGVSQTAKVVSTYINETPIFVNLRLRDIERVEVLRGPQGTLYGASSLGGSVRYLYNKPELDNFTADFSAGIGQTEHAGDINYEADVVLNFPMGEQFAFRAYVGYESYAGFIDKPNQYVRRSDKTPDLDNGSTDPFGDAENFYVGQPVFEYKKDVNDGETTSFRAALRWQPTDNFEALLSYHNQSDESGGPQFNSWYVYGKDSVKNAALIDEPFELDVDLTSLEISWDMKFATLSASASTYTTEGEGSRDLTSGVTSFFFYSEVYGSSPRPLLEAEQEFSEDGTIFEVRLASSQGERLDWVAGFYSMDQETAQYENQWFYGYDDYANSCFITTGTFGGVPCGYGTLYGIPEFDPNGPVAVEKDLSFVINQDKKFDETALFGELTVHLSDRWRVTGGARWFDQDYTTYTETGDVFIPDGVVPLTNSNQVDDVIYKLNTAFDLSESTMMYLTWAQGFRRGGANALPDYAFGFIPTDPHLYEYAPDKTENLELGIKGMLGERWRYSAAVYTIDWKDLQYNTACTPAAYLCAINAGDASTNGFELELVGRPIDNLDVNFAYGYLDSNLDSVDPYIEELIDSGQIFFGIETDVPLPGAPDHNLYMGANYSQGLSNGMYLDWGLNGSYRGESESTLGDSYRTDSFWLWNASVTLSKENWYVRAYINNMADERGIVTADIVEFGGPGANALISMPRTVGLLFRYWVD